MKGAAAAIDPTLAGVVDTTVDRVRETLKTCREDHSREQKTTCFAVNSCGRGASCFLKCYLQ